jgi:hypothetical protein
MGGFPANGQETGWRRGVFPTQLGPPREGRPFRSKTAGEDLKNVRGRNDFGH